MKTKSFIARRAFIGRLRPFISRAAAFIARSATCLVRAGLKPAPYCLLLLPLAAFAQADLTVCAGQGFMLTSKADAASISGGVTYTWYESYDGETKAMDKSNTPALTIAAGKSAAGTYKYVRWVASDACPAGVPSNTFTVAVNPAPTMTLLSGIAKQSVLRSATITPIIYTTANATGVTVSGALPIDAPGSWDTNTYTISGTINANADVTTYNYTVAPVNTTTSCTGTASAATISVLNPTSPTYAVTTNMYSVAGRVWSDWIHYDASSACSGSTTMRHVVKDDAYYYTRYCRDAIANTVCPSPWRLQLGVDVVAVADQGPELIISWLIPANQYTNGNSSDRGWWFQSVLSETEDYCMVAPSTALEGAYYGVVWPDQSVPTYFAYRLRCVQE